MFCYGGRGNRCLVVGKKSHDRKIGVAVEQCMKWQYLWQEQGKFVQEYMSEFCKQDMMLGITLKEPRVVMRYLGGLFSHHWWKLLLLSVKIIDQGSKNSLYINWTSKRGKSKIAKKRPTKTEERILQPQPKRETIQRNIANTMIWMGTQMRSEGGLI